MILMIADYRLKIFVINLRKARKWNFASRGGEK
jgi:hypothetical protein